MLAASAVVVFGLGMFYASSSEARVDYKLGVFNGSLIYDDGELEDVIIPKKPCKFSLKRACPK